MVKKDEKKEVVSEEEVEVVVVKELPSQQIREALDENTGKKIHLITTEEALQDIRMKVTKIYDSL